MLVFRLVKRTLVLPPVLPHCPDQPMKYAWGCTPNIESKKASQMAMANASDCGCGGGTTEIPILQGDY